MRRFHGMARVRKGHCAVSIDGTVLMWGGDDEKIPDDGMARVRKGHCAVSIDGTVLMWGVDDEKIPWHGKKGTLCCVH